MKRPAFITLWVALFVQVSWILANALLLHLTPGVGPVGITLTATFAVFAAGYGRWRWLAVVVRLLMSAEFLLAVCDRFGLLGAPGTGVYWGDFAHFVAYTRTVAGYAPAGAAPTLAVLATIAEIGLGVGLLLGVRTRATALGSTGLLLVYGVSMTLCLPAAEQFHYAVFLLCAGMAALSTVDATALSVDKWTTRHPKGTPATGPARSR